MVDAPARGRARGAARRRVQPHRRGRRGRPDAVLPGTRQPGLLPARTRRPAALRRHHGLWQRHERGRSADPAADHGFAAVLAHRDAGRRLPVRPGPHARPPGRRLRPGVGLLRPGVAGPRGVGCEADRGAVGRRPERQLRGRAVPAVVAGVERSVPGHGARLLAQPRRPPRRLRDPVHRIRRHVRRSRTSADGVGQPDHRPRRLHPGRPGVLRRQAQRGQRRGQPRRHRRQPLVELRSRGAHDRRRDPRPAWAPEPSPPRDAAAVLRRPDDPRRGRAGPHPAGQQQRLLPGRPDHVVRLVRCGRGAAGVHPASGGAPAVPPGVPAAPLPHRRRRRRRCAGSPRPARR